MAATRWSIDDVLARTDLAALLDQVAQPAGSSPRGRRWHCPVPDHTDSHASVTMFTDGRGHERWRCWSGDDHHRGDAIDLVVATQHLTRADAINELAQRAGLRAGESAPALSPRRPAPDRSGPRPLDPSVVRYAQACERILWSNTGRPVRAWLAARGLGEDVVRANHVGADPGRALLRRPRGLPHGTSAAATFPALDPHGTVRYLQTRYLHPPNGPKYDNPASQLGSNPRLAWAVPVGPARDDVLVVCEGIPDALTAAQAGYAAVGVLGSQCPDASVGLRLAARAERHDLRIVAVIDADPAGRAWGDRLVHHLETAGANCSTIEPPVPGFDLNDWARQDPSWPMALANTVDRDVRTEPSQPAPTIDLTT